MIRDGLRSGEIITFYSYKGGTGRSMALANVAWILASSGKRVLAIDWDLEAPGLHRYFEPFLDDKSLERSTGVIDFVRDFTAAAIGFETSAADGDREWYKDYANLLAHAVPVRWDFPAGGCLDFVPAGKQDAAYAIRVNAFDWQHFYEHLGGGVLIEEVKRSLRELYDFVLVDSRTGVSDTSGMCTVQIPDQLVVCFTLNRQSIYGASAAAHSAFRQRHEKGGQPTMKVWPVPTRVDAFEKERLEIAQAIARTCFSSLVPHLDPEQEDEYWGHISVSYEPYYAYEEILASFRDRPRQKGSMLSQMETIARYLSGDELGTAETMDESLKVDGLAAFTSRGASDFIEELTSLGREYESIRQRMSTGAKRTELMTQLVYRAGLLGGRDAGVVAEQFFQRDTEGGRIIAFALARKAPHKKHLEMVLSAISHSRSAFEQYHGLLVARGLISSLEPGAARRLHAAIEAERGRSITPKDFSRWRLATEIHSALGHVQPASWSKTVRHSSSTVGGVEYPLVECQPTTPHVQYDDVEERHGRYVTTRGNHALRLPRSFRIGRYLVTHEHFRAFVEDGAYEDDALWTVPRSVRRNFLTVDGKSPGPGTWLGARTIAAGTEQHPVNGIAYVEALAFVAWCNRKAAGPGRWCLPDEDLWEYAARAEMGTLYPWGDAFDPESCNSSESGIGGTSAVRRFESGASQAGCCDMAGNVWEFVVASDAQTGGCVLRGGSFKNNRFEVRSYLRLIRVPISHRIDDFGFRLVQIEAE